MATTQMTTQTTMIKASQVATARAIVAQLSEKFGFSAEEAIADLRLPETTRKGRTSKPKRVTPSIPLPFCGMEMETWCRGLRLNHGLLSQCTNERGEGGLCKTCSKHADDDGRPTYGLVTDRLVWADKHPDSPFRNHRGKTTTSYAMVMNKLSIERGAAETEATKFGMTIPEAEFTVRKAQRGRPRKNPSASDSEDERPKATRGRPRKAAKVLATAPGDDLINSLISSAGISSIIAEEATTPKAATPKAAKSPKAATPKAATPETAKSPKAATPKAAKSPKAATPKSPKAATPKSPTIPELKKKCKELGLKVGGKKDELISRIQAFELLKEHEDGALEEMDSELKEDTLVMNDHTNGDDDDGDESEDDDGDESEDDETEELVVSKWTHNGVEYLKSNAGRVFDVDTQDEIGQWNGTELVLD